MTSLPDSAKAVLESPALAHLVTLNPDGSPQVTIVWVGLDGDEPWQPTFPNTARSATSATTDASHCLSKPINATPWA